MKIGSVEINNPVVLAPMAGVTDKPFRQIIKNFGCGLVCGEMISGKALVYDDQRTKEMLDISPEEHPISIQLFGSDSKIMVEATKKLNEYPIDIIDINMGCPVPKVVKNGEGSALLKDLSKATEIIKAVVANADRPVTVKMRAGWERGNEVASQLAIIAEKNGVAGIAVHGRYREDFYHGKADWSVIKRVSDAVSIPVIGNGDVFSWPEAIRLKEETNCEGVMIGRGVLGNPWLIRETVAVLMDRPIPEPPTIDEKLNLIKNHLQLQIELIGETRGVKEMRKHLCWYLKGFPGAARAREDINKAETKKEMFVILERIKERSENKEI